MGNVYAEQILYGYYIKYESMLRLVSEKFQGSDDTNINVYIDMANMTQQLYQQDVMFEFPYVIASSVINLCAHIRSYFETRHRVKTRIYIVHSNMTTINNTQFIYDYNRVHRNKMTNGKINSLIENNIQLLKLMCSYFNDIYFINGTVEPSVIIYDRICKDEMLGNRNPSIIFTKDTLAYQIVAHKPNTVIFRPARKEGQDVSYYIDSSNCLYHSIISGTKTDPIILDGLNPKLLSLLTALTKHTQRSIKGLFIPSVAVRKLREELLNKNYIINEYNSAITIANVQPLIQPITEKLTTADYNILNRYKAVDLIFQHSIYMIMSESLDETYLMRLIDDNAIREINNKYFKTNPLDLNRL